MKNESYIEENRVLKVSLQNLKDRLTTTNNDISALRLLKGESEEEKDVQLRRMRELESALIDNGGTYFYFLLLTPSCIYCSPPPSPSSPSIGLSSHFFPHLSLNLCPFFSIISLLLLPLSSSFPPHFSPPSSPIFLSFSPILLFLSLLTSL